MELNNRITLVYLRKHLGECDSEFPGFEIFTRPRLFSGLSSDDNDDKYVEDHSSCVFEGIP